MDLKITKIPIPTPFLVGDVNVYLLQTKDENVLIDSGPDTDPGWKALLEGLAEAGLQPENIDRVLITHGHEDHYGLSARMWKAGARIFVPEDELPATRMIDALQFYQRELLEAGVPLRTRHTVLENLGSLSRYGQLPEDYSSLQPGSTLLLSGGVEIEVLATPGHTPGHISFFHAGTGSLFAGDTIISKITPNPILSRDPRHPSTRYHGIQGYLRTLEFLATLNVKVVFPGHRDDLTEIGSYLDTTRRFYEERQKKICRILKSNPQSVYGLATSLFSANTRLNIFLIISETLAHLDYLQANQRVSSLLKHGIRYYSTRDP